MISITLPYHKNQYYALTNRYHIKAQKWKESLRSERDTDFSKESEMFQIDFLDVY